LTWVFDALAGFGESKMVARNNTIFSDRYEKVHDIRSIENCTVREEIQIIHGQEVVVKIYTSKPKLDPNSRPCNIGVLSELGLSFADKKGPS